MGTVRTSKHWEAGVSVGTPWKERGKDRAKVRRKPKGRVSKTDG